MATMILRSVLLLSLVATTTPTSSVAQSATLDCEEPQASALSIVTQGDVSLENLTYEPESNLLEFTISNTSGTLVFAVDPFMDDAVPVSDNLNFDRHIEPGSLYHITVIDRTALSQVESWEELRVTYASFMASYLTERFPLLDAYFHAIENITNYITDTDSNFLKLFEFETGDLINGFAEYLARQLSNVAPGDIVYPPDLPGIAIFTVAISNPPGCVGFPDTEDILLHRPELTFSRLEENDTDFCNLERRGLVEGKIWYQNLGIQSGTTSSLSAATHTPQLHVFGIHYFNLNLSLFEDENVLDGEWRRSRISNTSYPRAFKESDSEIFRISGDDELGYVEFKTCFDVAPSSYPSEARNLMIDMIESRDRSKDRTFVGLEDSRIPNAMHMKYYNDVEIVFDMLR